MNIDTLNLAPRSTEALRKGNIETVQDLQSRWPNIRHLRSVGLKTYNDIGQKLAEQKLIPGFESVGKRQFLDDLDQELMSLCTRRHLI